MDVAVGEGGGGGGSGGGGGGDSGEGGEGGGDGDGEMQQPPHCGQTASKSKSPFSHETCSHCEQGSVIVPVGMACLHTLERQERGGSDGGGDGGCGVAGGGGSGEGGGGSGGEGGGQQKVKQDSSLM